MVSTDLKNPQGSVVLLRGLARQAAHWGDVPAMLQQHIAMPVYCPDLPGMGLASSEVVPWTLAEHVQLLKRRLDHQVPKPWHLVGLSLGGMAALELAVQAQADVHSVVLINSSVSNLARFYQRLQWRRYPTVLRCFYQDAQQREALILQLTSRQTSPHPALGRWQQLALAHPLRKSAVLKQLWAASRYQLESTPTCQGLVVVSDGDQLVSPRCSEQLAQTLHWPLVRHAWAGHDLPLDDAPWLISQLQRFYQSLSVN